MNTVQTIPLIEPYLGKNAKLYVDECFDSNWISSRGHFIIDFEKAFAKFVGTKYAVAVSNGTVALHLALICLNIKEGDEVIVPDITFSATINVVLHAKATPVIVDVEADTWNISAEKIKSAITSKTKAIIPVHIYGYPCNMSEILKIAAEYNLAVIEDAAESHGAEFDNKKVGSFGEIGTFSFFGNKILTTGEGGMCGTNDENIYEKMLLYRDHGMNKKNKYQYDVVGYNYRMTNIQAGVGLSQLEEIEQIIKVRNNVQEWYEKELKDVSGFTLRKAKDNIKPVNWLFTCLCNQRDCLMEYLTKENVETRPMFYPLHQMDIYKAYAKDVCSNAIKISKRGISLPTYYKIPYSYVERVCHLIKNNNYAS